MSKIGAFLRLVRSRFGYWEEERYFATMFCFAFIQFCMFCLKLFVALLRTWWLGRRLFGSSGSYCYAEMRWSTFAVAAGSAWKPTACIRRAGETSFRRHWSHHLWRTGTAPGSHWRRAQTRWCVVAAGAQVWSLRALSYSHPPFLSSTSLSELGHPLGVALTRYICFTKEFQLC